MTTPIDAPVSRTPSQSGRSYIHQQPPTHVSPLPSPSHSNRHSQNPSYPTATPADETLSNTLANSAAHPASHRDPYATPLAAPVATRPAKFTEEWDASRRGSSIVDGHLNSVPPSTTMQRSSSVSGSIGPADGSHIATALSRGNTLKKKPSLRRGGSLKRSSSRRSMKAGSVRSLALQSSTDEQELHSAFYCPVPTAGNPTEALAARFQAWRKILKDLISYFREVQSHYEHRVKSLQKLGNVLNSTAMPPGFLGSGGLDDALQILMSNNKQAVVESIKAKEIEEDVILALTGLRSDLRQKIKEIKNLSGDFKNSVDREMDATRKAVNQLQEALGQSDMDPALVTGKQDPYLLRLSVDRQLEKQIDEENYLHQAYLNLENSGRELESIVVGEIQKSYNAYAGIMKREADVAYNTVEELRVGPIAMPKDHEWAAFVQGEGQLVDPEVPIRSTEIIHYPGRDHLACQEVRAGLLERKSKYLKSYTAGWYVLSPTHLHEFKSADKTQAPVMSLYLPEQKLGSHSAEGGATNKFVLKGRQTGALHRGHTWVFRAESHDTMMAWYEDIKALTEKSPEERSNFVRVHSRSFSRSSQRSFSSDGVVDEDDDEPFSATNLVNQEPNNDAQPRRPEPGGRFPSDLQVNAERGLQAPLSPSSLSSGFNEHQDHDTVAAAAALPGSDIGNSGAPPADSRYGYGSTARTPMDQAPSHAAIVSHQAQEDGVNPYTSEPVQRRGPTNYTIAAVGPPSDGAGVGDARELSNGNPGWIENTPSEPRDHLVAASYAPQSNGGQIAPPEAAETRTANYIVPLSAGQHQATPPGVELEDNPYAARGRSPANVGFAAVPVVDKMDLDKSGYGQQSSQTHPANSGEQPLFRPEQAGQPEGTAVRSDRPHMHIPGEYPKSGPPAG